MKKNNIFYNWRVQEFSWQLLQIFEEVLSERKHICEQTNKKEFIKPPFICALKFLHASLLTCHFFFCIGTVTNNAFHSSHCDQKDSCATGTSFSFPLLEATIYIYMNLWTLEIAQLVQNTITPLQVEYS